MNDLIALSALRLGESGTIRRMENQGGMRRRLRDVGLIEGASVTCLGRSPGGDPAAYAVCGAVLALRDADSGQIYVHKEGVDAHGG